MRKCNIIKAFVSYNDLYSGWNEFFTKTLNNKLHF